MKNSRIFNVDEIGSISIRRPYRLFCTFNDHISFSQTKIMITFLKHFKIQFGMQIRYRHPLLFADLSLYSGGELTKLLIVQICNFGP